MKVIISGACGFMGNEVYSLCQKGFKGAECAAKIDVKGGEGVFTSLAECALDGDVVIDFSFHTGTKALLEEAIKRNLPAVIATTGHTPEEKQDIIDASKKIPVFYAANYSLGVAVTAKLVKEAASYLQGADIEIVETHHNRKVDAPSGTALMLAESVIQSRPELQIKCGRSGYSKREENELGIQAIRMGNVVGEHEVILCTANQTITLKHEAHNRALFAEGALVAAKYMVGKPAGIYNMKDMLKDN